MIYVPNDSTFNKCYVVQSEGVIRGYNKTPTTNTSYSYRDYYIRSGYIYRDGTGNWGNTINNIVCLDSNSITNDYMYRNDIADIMIVFIIMVAGVWFLISKLIKTLFHGFRRY